MSYRTGPKIVTDGLVCCLDAADRNSYPGTGSTWGDLSGNNNDFTINGPNFTNINNGCFNFQSGNSDYMRKTTSGIITDEITIDVWFYISAQKSYHGILGSNVSERCEIITKLSTQFECSLTGNNWVQYDNQVPIQTWLNFTVSASNGIQWKTYKYANDLGNPTNSNGNWSINGSVSYIDIGRIRNQTLFSLDGIISNIKIYNRALSANEVRQNFEATKGRFGL